MRGKGGTKSERSEGRTGSVDVTGTVVEKGDGRHEGGREMSRLKRTPESNLGGGGSPED